MYIFPNNSNKYILFSGIFIFFIEYSKIFFSIVPMNQFPRLLNFSGA